MALGISNLFNAVKQLFSFNKEINIQHQITLIAQTGSEESWVAAIKMLSGSPNPTLKKGKGEDVDNIVTFARINGFYLYAPQKWTVKKLTELLRKGPIAMGGMMKGNAFIVISGLKTDGRLENTLFTIHDPQPKNIGTFLPMVTYDTIQRRFPEVTTCILQK